LIFHGRRGELNGEICFQPKVLYAREGPTTHTQTTTRKREKGELSAGEYEDPYWLVAKKTALFTGEIKAEEGCGSSPKWGSALKKKAPLRFPKQQGFLHVAKAATGGRQDGHGWHMGPPFRKSYGKKTTEEEEISQMGTTPGTRVKVFFCCGDDRERGGGIDLSTLNKGSLGLKRNPPPPPQKPHPPTQQRRTPDFSGLDKKNSVFRKKRKKQGQGGLSRAGHRSTGSPSQKRGWVRRREKKARLQ